MLGKERVRGEGSRENGGEQVRDLVAGGGAEGPGRKAGW